MSEPITIVGAGAVGTNLGVRLASLGHAVTFAARDTESPAVRAALAAARGSQAVSVEHAAAGARFVILAVPFPAVEDVVTAIREPGSAIVIDATNAVGIDLPDDARSVLDVIAAKRPETQLVKAFNTIGAEAFLDPRYEGRRVFLPIAGDDEAASAVRELALQMGFDARIVGGREDAHLLEGFARLWIHMAFRAGEGRGFGFSIIRDVEPATG